MRFLFMIQFSPAKYHTIPPPTLQILSAVCRFGFTSDTEEDYPPRQRDRITAAPTDLRPTLTGFCYQLSQRAADLAGV
ncbi:MAG: hypothetical protein WBK08_15405 [Nitrospira sp.]